VAVRGGRDKRRGKRSSQRGTVVSIKLGVGYPMKNVLKRRKKSEIKGVKGLDPQPLPGGVRPVKQGPTLETARQTGWNHFQWPGGHTVRSQSGIRSKTKSASRRGKGEISGLLNRK